VPGDGKPGAGRDQPAAALAPAPAEDAPGESSAYILLGLLVLAATLGGVAIARNLRTP